MSLFGKKRTVTTLSSILSVCTGLARGLKAHYSRSFNSSSEESSARSRVFDGSGINAYRAGKYSNSPMEYNPSDINYKLQERLGPVLAVRRLKDSMFIPTYPNRFCTDIDVVYITLLDRTDPSANAHIVVTGVVPYSVYMRKYSGLKKGDTVNVDGPVVVECSHNCHPFSAEFNVYVDMK